MGNVAFTQMGHRYICTSLQTSTEKRKKRDILLSVNSKRISYHMYVIYACYCRAGFDESRFSLLGRSDEVTASNLLLLLLLLLLLFIAFI